MLDTFLTWAGRGASIAGVLLATFCALRLRRPLVRLFFRWGILEADRAPTLEPMLVSASRWLIWLAALLAALSVLGADVRQVLTGAGIVGVALGLGAQNVVRDVIAGFFIMVENQFHPGDYIQINGDIEGLVESLDLRMTRLRGWDGAVVCIGNAAIVRVKNFNRDGMRVIIEASVPFEADHARVRQAIEALCGEMARTHREHFLPDDAGGLLEPPFLYGITDISSTKGVGATYCIMGLTRVDSYWLVGREIRRLLLERLRQYGVHLSYPQRVWHEK